MAYYERKIKSGQVLEIIRYKTVRTPGVYYPRKSNIQVSTPRQKAINAVESKRWLTRKINSNFMPGDLFITLTYSKEPKPDQAAKELAKYIRRLRAYRKKEGLEELKYIVITEATETRLHHHMIINAMSSDAARNLWQYESDPKDRKTQRKIKGHGRAPTDTLDSSGDYSFLARYLGKQDKPGRRRWSCSQNLKEPEVSKPKPINPTAARRAPRTPKGYVLSKQTTRNENPDILYLNDNQMMVIWKYIKLEIDKEA